jgi:TBC1 domain family member 10
VCFYAVLCDYVRRMEQPPLLSVSKIRERELKWRKMMDNWTKSMGTRAGAEKVRSRCQKGIPSSCRGRAWALLTGASKFIDDEKTGGTQVGKQTGITYAQLVAQPGVTRWLTAIQNDVTRQFPEHSMFAERGGYGQTDLFDLLKAYTILYPVEGYCQAQAPVACILLMHMPVQHAFWCFVQICTRETLLSGYYSQGLVRTFETNCAALDCC